VAARDRDIAAGRLVAPFGFVQSGKAYVALRRKRRNNKAEAFVQWLVEEAETLPRPEIPSPATVRTPS
jgi:DNA-binding transcriptional LysR family regulator